MTVRDDLLRAYALIQDQRAWCRYYSAENRQSQPVEWYSHLATRWCLDGAVARSTMDGRSMEYITATDALATSARALFGRDYISVNEDYGHRAALMVLRHAILREEGLA